MKRSLACWPLMLGLCLAGCGEKKKDLSPPPLNPHPKEAVHVRVEFDNPDDAKNFTITMTAHYQNQQRECGYIANWWVGNFVYPEGEFDIPNESSDPRYGDFTVYQDRYNRETCNWEFGLFAAHIHNGSTKWEAATSVGWNEIVPGMEFKTTCNFVSASPNICWHEPPPDFPWTVKVPITIRVLENSAPMRPHQPGFFSRDNFLPPMNPEDVARDSSKNPNH
ncbi:hypothetical protein [Dyella sp.]|uniref:hypothetical protein n=1 Tax=Dyella sp. TaxID=1869338 RepID=UPI002B474F52|nr:hypothetical protein [Dyella sp.]HKT27923.1 hypothetical protein [Dyella sp.]